MTEQIDQNGQGRHGALAALREVAAAADHQRFGLAIASFEDEDYSEIVRLAWRHQFDDDRSPFKRDLRQLEEQISARILARLELQGE